MYQTDFDEFSGLMRDLCAAFNRPLNDDLVRVYWDALKSHPLPVIRSSMKSAAANLKKFPPPSDLRPPRETPMPSTFQPLPTHPDWDNFHCFAQRCLMKFILQREGQTSDDELQRLLAVKRRLVKDFRGIHCEDDPVTAEQFRESLFENFRRSLLARAA